MNAREPGWYYAHAPGLRYWTGQAWTAVERHTASTPQDSTSAASGGPAPRRPPVSSLTRHPLTIGVGLLLAASLAPAIHGATTRPVTHAATRSRGTSPVPLEIAPFYEDVRAGQLLATFGCTKVDVTFDGLCLDDDTTLTSLEAWEAFRGPITQSVAPPSSPNGVRVSLNPRP